jgi:uncharacterized damage-inducible protein DinB
MNSTTALADAIERAVDGPAWHGPALREILKDVSPVAAFAHPIADAHSIWELVLHLAVWADIAHERLRGQTHTSVPPEEDFPRPTAQTDAAWAGAQARLDTGYRELARHVRKMSEEDLARLVATSDGQTTAQIMLRGVIEHGAYHGGQMSLLKRIAT